MPNQKIVERAKEGANQICLPIVMGKKHTCTEWHQLGSSLEKWAPSTFYFVMRKMVYERIYHIITHVRNQQTIVRLWVYILINNNMWEMKSALAFEWHNDVHRSNEFRIGEMKRQVDESTVAAEIVMGNRLMFDFGFRMIT